jgi:hypothetical protein
VPRSSWSVTAPGGKLSVEDGRAALCALQTPGLRPASTGDRNYARRGFRPGFGDDDNPGMVTAAGGSTLTIAPFQLFLPTVRATGGAYIITQDSAYTWNGLATPAHGSLPRIDRVIVQQNDSFYGDADSECVIRQVVGTPAGAPQLPPIDGSLDWYELARINVAANQTNLALAGTITDMRGADFFTVASGGILPVPDTAARNNMSGAWPGMTVFNRAAKRLETYESATAGWKGAVGQPPVITSLTSPGIPVENNLVVLYSANGELYRYSTADAAFRRLTYTDTSSTIITRETGILSGDVDFGGDIPRVRRTGATTCALFGTFKRSSNLPFVNSGSGTYTLGTVPAEFRPSATRRGLAAGGAATTASYDWRWQLTTDGVLSAYISTAYDIPYLSIDGVYYEL